MIIRTKANPINQSSAPNFNFEILLDIQRKTTAIVLNMVRIVIVATISGPRLSLSHGTTLVQIRRVDERDTKWERTSVSSV